MRKIANFAGLAAVFLWAGASFLGGCSAESSPSLTLTGLRAWDIGEDGCTADDSGDDFLVSDGFDAGKAAKGLGAFRTSIEVENNMPSSEDLSAGRVDANGVQLTDIEVTFDSSGPWSFLKGKSRVVPVGAIVKSSGKALLPIAAIESELAKLLINGDGTTSSPIANRYSNRELVVNFKAHGKFADGTEIESNELPLLVTVCNDCLACPDGTVAQGCSFVQSDGFECVAPEAPATP